MPLPVIPLVVVGLAGVFAGSRLSGDDAQVIVNQTPTESGFSKTALLIGGSVLVAGIVVAPKVLGK